MHPFEKAIEFLLNEHIRKGDSHAVQQAEAHLVAIAESRETEAAPPPAKKK